MLPYDDIWMTFLDMYKVNAKDVSNTDEKIYDDIRFAVSLYNNRMRTRLECDDTSECVKGACGFDTRLLIAAYIKLTYLNNSKTVYETLYQPISPDVGIRNYNTQINSLSNSIKRQEDYIEGMIFNAREDLL